MNAFRQLLFSLLLTSCATTTNSSQIAHTTYVAPKSREVLLITGLNNSSESMSELASVVANRGYKTRILVLPGHRHSDEEITKDDWTTSVSSELNKLSAPTTVVGFSLGALALLHALDEHNTKYVERLVLLSPPLGMRPWANLTSILTFVLPSSFCLPSFAPKKFRVRACIPVAWYEFASVMQEQVLLSPQNIWNSIDVMVVLSTSDEIVSPSRVVDWIARARLDWRISTVSPVTELPDTFGHYMVDSRSMGVDAWKQIVEAIAPQN